MIPFGAVGFTSIPPSLGVKWLCYLCLYISPPDQAIINDGTEITIDFIALMSGSSGGREGTKRRRIIL